MIDRRTMFGAMAASVATAPAWGAAAAGGAAGPAGATHPGAAPRGARPDFSFLRTEPLVNAERARAVMARAGLDAFVVTQPANVFYLGNHWPNLDRMGFRHSVFVIFPRDPRRPVALVMQGFLHYYRYADDVDMPDRVVFPYTAPLAAGADAVGNTPDGPAPGAADPGGREPPAAPTRLHRILDESLVTPREQRRRSVSAAAEPPSATPDWALAKALRHLGLEKGTLGIDDPVVEALVARRGLAARCTGGEDALRRTRLVKTPAELRLMRLAARNNVEAATRTVAAVRELGSTGAVRDRYFAEAMRLGNQPVFIVVDGSSSEIADVPIREGQAFSIDCVSSLLHYHGDFARTIFVGEPHPRVRRGTAAVFTAWQEIRGQLRAGMRFADVQRIGREAMRKQGADFTVNFTPHSVGLWHTDHPQPSLTEGRSVEGLVLEKDMVLSVDCPILDTGMGGTVHLEDLMLIADDGAAPIHDVPPNVFVV
ncbi:MAG: M24 family metallopeptidase [Steroidobacteraceae bacterium]|jgi:Xaa-Pro aminopeptidase|nr:M24 family metallopeptidase [Steroidobacteraceae bacterium]